MAQAGVSLTKLHWNRSCGAVSILLLFFQKTLFPFFGAMLLVPLFVLSDRISFAGARSDCFCIRFLVCTRENRICPMLRHLRQLLNKAPRQSFHSCRHSLAGLSNRWTLETSSNTWWSPRSARAASSRTLSAPGYAWQILLRTTLMNGALELRHLDATTETALPVLERKASGVSPLPFCSTKILVIGALKAPSFLRAWAMPLSSPLSIERTGAIAQLPSQTSPAPQPAVLLATHTFRPASIT